MRKPADPATDPLLPSVGRMFLAIVAGVMLSSVPCPAAESELDRVLQQLDRSEQQIRSITFSFTQTTAIHATEGKQTMTGKAYFKKPDQFRIEQIEPRQQLVCSDGKRLWLYLPDRRQLIVDSWKNWQKLSGFPKGLMTFQESILGMRKRYRFELRSHSDEEGTVLLLSPVKKTAWPFTLRLQMDIEKGIPLRTELVTDSFTIDTRIMDPVVNPDLDENLFRFQPPEGVSEIPLSEGMAP